MKIETHYINNIKIAEVRKSLHIQVADCNTIQAVLPATTTLCDGFTKSFSNTGNSINVQTYDWDFGDPTSGSNTSNLSSPSHLYNSSGNYTVKLVEINNAGCKDSIIKSIQVVDNSNFNFPKKYRNVSETFTTFILQ